MIPIPARAGSNKAQSFLAEPLSIDFGLPLVLAVLTTLMDAGKGLVVIKEERMNIAREISLKVDTRIGLKAGK